MSAMRRPMAARRYSMTTSRWASTSRRSSTAKRGLTARRESSVMPDPFTKIFRWQLEHMAGNDPDLELRPDTDCTDSWSIISLYETEKEKESDVEAGVVRHVVGFPLSILVTGLTIAASLLMIDSTVLVMAIPSITSVFDSLDDVGWYGSSYLLATCALQLLFGKIYQFHNSKVTFIGAFIVFGAGSLICALARSSIVFIFGRAVAGCGGAGVLNGVFIIIAAAVPLKKRPIIIGIILGVASTGAALGPLIGGALTQYVSWRWCFYINIPFVVITVALLASIRVPNVRLRGKRSDSIKQKLDRLDFLGCILFAGSVVMLLLAINWGGVSYSWNSPTVINLFWGAAYAFFLFLVWEYRQGEDAMLPLKLLRNPIVSFAAVSSVMSYGGLFVIIIYLPLWFQAAKGASPLDSGIYYLPTVITTTLGTVASGIFVSKLGYYTPFMIIGSAIAAIAAGLMSTLTPSSTNAAWICYQLLNGVARGLMSQQPITAVQANLSKEHLSIGTALIVFSQNFGASLFISLGQMTFGNSLLMNLAKFAPEVDAEKTFGAGATLFRTVIPKSSLLGVLLAYNKALTTTFYLSVGSSCTAFALAWGLGWKNLNAGNGAQR